jgi:hypothetical protein
MKRNGADIWSRGEGQPQYRMTTAAKGSSAGLISGRERDGPIGYRLKPCNRNSSRCQLESAYTYRGLTRGNVSCPIGKPSGRARAQIQDSLASWLR